MTAYGAARQAERTIRALEVQSFRRVELCDPTDWAELVVEPGERGFLTVEGPPDIVRRVRAEVDGETLRITLGGGVGERLRDTLTTSLTRRHVTYRVQAPRVDEVRLLGLVRVRVDAFGADAPVVTRLEPAPPVAPWPPAPD